MKQSDLEAKAEQRLSILSLPERFVKEFEPFPDRKHRIDFAFPAAKIAIEAEGGLYTRGRHNRPQGMIDDMYKYNRLSIEGWILIRVAEVHIDHGDLDEWLRQAFNARGL